MKRLVPFLNAAFAVFVLTWSGVATASQQYYTSNCATCHAASPVTCNGCHAHGTHANSSKSTINIAGALNKSSFAPGETVTVTMTGGYRTGWLRGFLLDQNLNELARSTCPGGFGNCTTSVYPITLTATAPSAPGTYSWAIAWYGSDSVKASGASYGSGTSATLQRGYFTPDSTNPGHGYQVVSIPSFTVVQPATPAITLSPASLSFGTVQTGGSASLTTQLQNTGNAALIVSGITLCSGTPARFTWAPSATPFTVAAGGSTTLTVTYTPVGAITDSGCLAIASNATATPTVNLAVTGTGQVPAAPKIVINPTSLAFGDVTVGTSSARSIAISNTGNAALTGTVALASAQYSVTPASFNVAAGGSVSVTVTFSPTAVAAANGNLTVSSNDTATPTVAVAVTGSGVAAPAPNIALSPATLAFGTITIGGQASLTTQIKNLGTAPLDVTSIALCSGTPARFTWSPGAPFTVAPNGSSSLTVTYTPSGAVTDSGCLTVASNDTAKPTVQLGLSGTGQAAAAPRIVVSPISLDFGTVTVGGTLSRIFTIGNAGDAQLTGALVLPTSSSAFTLSPTAFSLAPGAKQDVTVTFRPTTATMITGAVAVTSNDATSPTISVALSGTGVSTPVATISLAPSSLAFGSVTVSSSASLTTQVQNTGTAPLNVTAISLCNGTSSAFTWVPSAPFSVAPGSSTVLTVTYAPRSVATDTGCLSISSDDLAHPSVQLALAGSGVTQATPAIALDPASLDFGSVVVGTSVTRIPLLRNTGTAALSITSIALCPGTSAAFSWSPSAPLSIAPGQSQSLTVKYSPTSAGTATGCLSISSNDPVSPTVTLAVTGTATDVPVSGVDIDILRLTVPHHVSPQSSPTITPRLNVKNTGTVDGTASATLVGSIEGKEVYRKTASVKLASGQRGTVSFSAYKVERSALGVILWTITIEDGNADVDRATARTILGSGEIDDAEGEHREADRTSSRAPAGAESLVTGAGVAVGGPQAIGDVGAQEPGPSGCNSTNDTATGLMLLVPLAAWAMRRRSRGAANS